MTTEEALNIFSELTTKKNKLEFVKQQILIRYLGLGWKETDHPWPKDGIPFCQ